MNSVADVNLKYLHKNTSRHGTDRWYVRRPGHKLIRIHGEPGSQQFMDAYFAAMKGEVGIPTSTEKPVATKVVAGSFRELCIAYKQSQEFKQLSGSTQTQRSRVIDSMLLEPVIPGKSTVFGDGPAAEITSKLVRILRDRKADAPEAANHRLKVLRQVFGWACENERLPMNPARDVKPLKSVSEGHHTWTVEEVGQYLRHHPAGSKARLALGLLLFLGIRISDLALIGPQHVKDGEITFTPFKTRATKGKALTLPVLPALELIMSQSETGHLAFMVTDYGKPFSIKGLGQWFKKQCVRAGLDHCSAHGLRKAGATICAENGATEEQLKAIYGWENAKEANLYTRKARQKMIAGAAMPLLDLGEMVNKLIHHGAGAGSRSDTP